MRGASITSELALSDRRLKRLRANRIVSILKSGVLMFSNFPTLISTFIPALIPTRALALLALVSASAFAQVSTEQAPYNNVYEQIRAEQLLELGQQQLFEQDFAGAEKTFLEALQIAKVNYGLSAPQQRNALGYVIEAQLAQEKWDQAGSQLSYFEWLNDQIYSHDFYNYLLGTEQLSDVLLRASANAGNSNSTRYLLAAKNLNWRAVSGIEATLGENHVELTPWLYNIVLAHYYQISLLKRPSMFSDVVIAAGEDEWRGRTLAKGESLRISYRIGKDLLQRIVDIYEAAADSPPESSALARIYQADWDLLFGLEPAALALYQQAYETLLDQGVAPERANTLFQRPMVLPAPTLAISLSALELQLREGPIRFDAWTPNYPATALPKSQLAMISEGGEQFKATLSFDLMPRLPEALIANQRSIKLGFNLRNLEVISVTPEDEQLRERARYEVSLLQMRPALENGLPIVTENVELEYLFAPQSEALSASEN